MIYQKLLKKAGEVSDQFNILSILEEIDTCDYLQHYFIPVLANLQRLLEESNTVSAFISSIFPQIWIMPDKVMHVRFAPGAFRFTQILDKKKDLFRELYDALREEASKIDAAYIKPSGHKKPKRAYEIEFKSAPTEITSILNRNERLFKIRNSFATEVGQLMDEAYEKIRIQREIDEDIFSMI